MNYSDNVQVLPKHEPVSRGALSYSTLGSRIPHTPGTRFFCKSSFECILKNSIVDEGGDGDTEDDAGFVVKRGTYSVLPEFIAGIRRLELGAILDYWGLALL